MNENMIGVVNEMLFALKGATFCEIKIRTTVKVKKDCPVVIEKESLSNGMLNFIYENNVNAQLDRENKIADFVSKPLPWGNRVMDNDRATCLIEHKGKRYLQFRALRSDSVKFFANGIETDKASLSTWLPPARAEGENQGTDKAIIIRTPALENIREIRLNNQVYVL